MCIKIRCDGYCRKYVKCPLGSQIYLPVLTLHRFVHRPPAATTLLTVGAVGKRGAPSPSEAVEPWDPNLYTAPAASLRHGGLTASRPPEPSARA